MKLLFNNKILVIFWVYLIIFPFFSYAASDEYPAFLINGLLKQNGDLAIDEKFIFDFGDKPRHGIYRSIPLVLDEDENWFGLQSVSVRNKDGEPFSFETTDTGNIGQIKIGNPNITLTGTHYYDISYTLTNIGKEDTAKWKLISLMREPILKLQANLYLPVKVPDSLATATCLFIPERKDDSCNITPILNSGFISGYKLEAQNVAREDILISVKYPKGIVSPIVNKNEHKVVITESTLYIGIIILILFIFVLIYALRNKLNINFSKNKKEVVSPDKYSYLARAMSYKGKIEPEDVVATLVDLSERGYISISEFAHPVGMNECIDYSIDVISDENPDGAEGLILEAISSHVSSLHEWLSKQYLEYSDKIENLAAEETKDVILLKSDEKLPGLMSFKSNLCLPKFN